MVKVFPVATLARSVFLIQVDYVTIGFNTNRHVPADTRNVLECMKCRSCMEASREATRAATEYQEGSKRSEKKDPQGQAG